MASMWRQAMLYLGLGPDEEYDEVADQPAGGSYRPPASESETEADGSAVTLPSDHETIRTSPMPAGKAAVK